MLFSQGFNFSGYLANFFIYQSLKEDFTKLFGSGFINLNATLLTSDNSESMLGFIYFYGTKGSEYWYYSSSLFLKVQFYF